MQETPTQSVPAAEVAGKTLVEEFMAMSYEFRRNVLSDKYEVRECNMSWRAVTRESQNTILRLSSANITSIMSTSATSSIRRWRWPATFLSTSRKLRKMNFLQTLHLSIQTMGAIDYQPLPLMECLF